MEANPSKDEFVLIQFEGKSVPATIRDGKVLLPKSLALPSGHLRTQRFVGPRRASKNVRVRYVKQAGSYSTAAVARRVIDVLGNNTVAALLDVNQDRPNRWASGQAEPNEENRMQLADLDALAGHLLAAFTPEQAVLWLDGHDPYLNARPIDVYRLEGAGPVIEAMKAYEQGAFA
ncbi:hypothetical protein [Arthrobacter sp. Marseille-P9274]|uniref:hypothetical protein n=1 Tax=Arthrobacter sp. Marseille-P9274 TaxID=2866572 RepID=UPI0021C98583|nr:hypothetical protein [Arthrobacter sp. Marseille-P9274]